MALEAVVDDLSASKVPISQAAFREMGALSQLMEGLVDDQLPALALPRLVVRRLGHRTADSSATVYGCMGRSYRSLRLASSTRLPRYMTATRLATWRITDRSCAITT